MDIDNRNYYENAYSTASVVYVANIPFNMTKEDLATLFKLKGITTTVLDLISILQDKQTFDIQFFILLICILIFICSWWCVQSVYFYSSQVIYRTWFDRICQRFECSKSY